MNDPSEIVTAGPLVAGGDALVRRPNQKTLFVRGALPRELVRVTITEQRKDLARAEVSEVIEASPQRREAPCAMFDAGCGGCQWQFAQHKAQQQYKLEIVRDALARIAGIDDPTLTSFGGAVSPFGYRTTLRMAMINGKPALRSRGTHEMVPLDLCAIAHPALSELIEEGKFTGTSEVTLRVSVSTGKRIAWTHGSNATLDLPTDVTVTSNGKATLVEEVAGRSYQLGARSFFQSGKQAAELLAAAVDAEIPHDVDWIVDAYAGIGLLGATVASRRNCRLTAIEQSHAAAADARANLADLDAEVIEAEVAKVSLAGSKSPDVIIADPARPGLGPSATATLAHLGAERIILVSCDPASFARDAKLMSQRGYMLQRAKVFDFFPQTHHVETVSVFDRQTLRNTSRRLP